ncbi:hypothetical protein PHYSODRAFT_343244 [Phytophthora sojae]|uniref:DDE Tnp4 domain-containing protein n=1 Tax=Phytophthora sojae (strain P6497) TaxID=1094619 RepID=G5AJ34_PHYSP|nr:hypothetical protein PHYSODRAFT_343244 [Phytophthora sojae]EGZ04466.1 hypothetical protein PHYSODRAFT_343244 [Phytophthora sojae]|eukprot:XP_009540085.1 hypothetical protein PHYSODRAFT_343244 [Phytophthora sojae]
MIDGDDGVILLLYEAYKAYTERVRDARRDVHQLLLEEEWRVAMRSRHYLTTQCLDAPCASGWMTLYEYGTDINFLNATSLTRTPTKLRYLQKVLGLVLTFYVGSLEQSSLCITFGVPPNTLSRTLRKAEEALARALNGYAPARISWPSPSCQVELARMVNKREPLLTHTFGFINGKNLRVQEPSNADLQNAMYNGWLHSVFFRGKLTDLQYCPDGRMSVVSDSAFPCSTAVTGRILTPLKDGDIEKIEPSLRATARTLHNAITSIRQAAEWGMGSVQKVYSRLNLPLPYDPNLRGMRIGNLFRLANYRVRTVGISEIKTTLSGAMEMPEQLAL